MEVIPLVSIIIPHKVVTAWVAGELQASTLSRHTCLYFLLPVSSVDSICFYQSACPPVNLSVYSGVNREMCLLKPSQSGLITNILLYYLDLPPCANGIFIKEGRETCFCEWVWRDFEWGLTGCLPSNVRELLAQFSYLPTQRLVYSFIYFFIIILLPDSQLCF